MPIQTDLSVSPYFDDYSETNDYYKILFRPGVAVQVRELNQLQTLLQAQIEKFGDSVFKRGTIIDGCNFSFFDNIKYAKLKDIQTDGAPVNVITFKNLFARDSDGLTAYVIDTTSGFESQDPDLNTIYIRYVNSGSTYNRSAFDKNSILTIYDQTYPITKALVNEGSTGFSNADNVVVMSAIALQNTIGGSGFAANTWVINSKIIQDTTGAAAEILEVNATANSTALILKVRPLETDLSNSAVTANAWTFSAGFTITGANLGATTANASANALVTGIVGSGAVGTLVTDSTGKITTVAITAGGSEYYIPPHITFSSEDGAIQSANVVAYNYLSQVTIQNDDSGVGNSYGVAVGEGIIYQKGYFSRVSEQLVIVEKYSTATTPDEKVVGFDTIESIVDSNADQSLLDNSLGTFNYTAPGANRIKLAPTLIVLNKFDADANTDFLPLVEFSKGRPFKQTRNTQFNKIGIELAQRTYDESGNYVIDQFQSTTKSPDIDEANTFQLAVDPGLAYIKGNRIESVLEYTETLNKGIDSIVASNVNVDLNYGNYIRVTNLGGYFQFNTGEVVSLRSAVSNYTANTDLVGTQPAAPGTEIGKARMRSLVYESGEPGSTAVYKLYLFDVVMNSGQNFADVKSTYYDGVSYKGYADIVLENSKAFIKETDKNFLVFPTGYEALKTANAITYTYRTVDNAANAASNGVVTAVKATGVWSYVGGLSSIERADIIAVPMVDLVTANLGTAAVGTGSTANTIVTLANTTLGAALNIGDYIKVFGTSDRIRRVVGITNTSQITVDKSFGLTNATSNVAFICPKYVPLQLNTRSDRTANVSGDNLIIDIKPPANFVLAGNTVAVAYNAKRANIPPTAKTTLRNRYVKIRLANNVASTTGPWHIGVPDVFRLKAVYIASSATVNSASTDVTNDFFIDHNQTENVYDNSFLFKKPESSLTLTAADHLLVKYDAYTKTSGVYTVTSYSRDDNSNLATLDLSTANVHTLEIPEMYTSRGEYFDLRDIVDFRVSSNTVANTAVVTDTDVNMSLNPGIPAYDDKIDDTTEKYFPMPESDMTFTTERYLGRSDRVILNANGDFIVLNGTPGSSTAPDATTDSLTINLLTIPPYPSIPKNLSANTIQLLDSNVANIKYTNQRQAKYSIIENIDKGNIIYEQPIAYKMTDIAAIDRRLRNIEYRVDLKDSEDELKNTSLKSSVDGSDRFKFGFFVDNFQSVDYSDLDDPEYSALNFDYRMTAKKKQNNLKHKIYANTTTSDYATGKLLTLPYEEYSIARQLNATSTISNTSIITQSTASYDFYTSKTTAAGYDSGKVKQEADVELAFSNTAGQVILYAMAYGGRDRYEVYQSTTPGFTPTVSNQLITSQSAQALTTADVNYVRTKLTSLLNKPTTSLRFASSGANPKYWMQDYGKVAWRHDPAKGKYYKIRVIKGSPWTAWRLEYPADSLSSVTVSALAPTKMEYTGSLNNVDPKVLRSVAQISGQGYNAIGGGISMGGVSALTISAIVKYFLPTTSNLAKATTVSMGSSGARVKLVDKTSGASKITIQVSGLRPLTKHDFYFNNRLMNSKVQSTSGVGSLFTFGVDAVGQSNLITDDKGSLNIVFYYDNGIPDAVTETTFVQLQSLINGVGGDKPVKIISSDGLSKLEFKISTSVTVEQK
jgi:hypothetical protein